MAISVVCPGCKKRFNVSEKFAGQKGPCPQCKTVILIPGKTEEVEIHAPEAAGPKDSKGVAVLRPILREETNFNPRAAGIVAAVVIAVFVAAWMVGGSYASEKKDKKAPNPVPVFWQALAALALGPPLALAGYSFLRDDELEPFRNRDLWIRVAICGAVYAVLWGVFGYLPSWLGLKEFELPQLMYVAPPFIALGAFAACLSLELEFMTGLVHYGLYLIATVLLRVTAGMHAF